MERLEKLEEEQQRELAELEEEQNMAFFLWKELFFLESFCVFFFVCFFLGLNSVFFL